MNFQGSDRGGIKVERKHDKFGDPYTLVYRICIHQYQFLITPQGVSDEVCKDVFNFLKGGETIYLLDYVKVLAYEVGGERWSSLELGYHKSSKTTVTRGSCFHNSRE
jgi:hypothetical protein